MLLQHLLLAFVWIVYGVLHSLLASTSIKRRLQKLLGKQYRFYRLFYTFFAALSLGVVLFYQFSVPAIQVFQQTPVTTAAGILLAIAGLAIMLVCIRKYFFSLSGLKSLVQETVSSELMIEGVHRFVRHPLYTGTFLAIWGLWLFFPYLNFLIANSVITIYTLYAIRLEEEKLVLEFGDKYRDYQKTVPKLVPRF